MRFNQQQFLSDFKEPWQQEFVRAVLEHATLYSFQIIGYMMREHQTAYKDVLRFRDFLLAIGFMQHTEWRFQLNKNFIPKNQR